MRGWRCRSVLAERVMGHKAWATAEKEGRGKGPERLQKLEKYVGNDKGALSIPKHTKNLESGNQ